MSPRMLPQHRPKAPVVQRYLDTSFEVVRYVHDNMDKIAAVANHLTPVEDLVDFKAQIELIHQDLGALVEASNIILQATPEGLALLTAIDVATQRFVLGLGSAALQDEEYFAKTSEMLQARADLTALQLDVASLKTSNVDLLAIVNFHAGEFTRLDGELSSQALAIATNGSIIDGLSLTMTQHGNSLSTHAQRLTQLDASVLNLNNGQAAHASALSTLDARATATEAGQQVFAGQLTQLEGRIDTADGNIAGNANALAALTVTVTQQGNDLTIVSEDIVKLESRIGPSGNLIPNADFARDTDGWTLVPTPDWENADLTRDWSEIAFMPPGTKALLLSGSDVTAEGSIGITSAKIPVTGGGYYIPSAYLASEGCTVRLEWRAYDVNDVLLDQGIAGIVTGKPADNNLMAWPRVFEKLTLSNATASLELQVWADTLTGTLPSNPKAWLLRPMLEQVDAVQGGPSLWAPGTLQVDEALATAVNQLKTEVTVLDGEVTALAQDTTALDARVGTSKAAISQVMITQANKDNTHAAAINQLSARMDNTELNVSGYGSAISNLQTTVSSQGDTISVHSSQLTNLQGQITNLDGTVNNQATAISGLQTTVSQQGDTINSHSSLITNLTATVDVKTTTFVQGTAPPSTGRIVGDLWINTSDNNKVYTWNGSWVLRTLASEGITIFAQGTAPPSTGRKEGDLWFNTADNNRQYRWNGNAWVELTDPRIAATATAHNTLNAQVQHSTTGLQATANNVTNLSTTVGNHTATISQHATSINGLNARWGVTLDVNGHVSGVSSVNNGTISEFNVNATIFKISAPGGGARTEYSGGHWRVYDANGILRVRMGVW